MHEDPGTKQAHDPQASRPRLPRRLAEAIGKTAVVTATRHLVGRWLDENPDALERAGQIVDAVLSLFGG